MVDPQANKAATEADKADPFISNSARTPNLLHECDGSCFAMVTPQWTPVANGDGRNPGPEGSCCPVSGCPICGHPTSRRVVPPPFTRSSDPTRQSSPRSKLLSVA